jgi:hypothetical protein
MDDVILKGGGKEILDIDECIFFYIKDKKDLEYVNNSKLKKKIKNINFPFMFVKLISSMTGEQMDLVYPSPKNLKMEKIIEDYKKGKISKKMNNDFLDMFMKKFVIDHLKNGIYRNTNIKINLLKKTKLIFVNAIAHKDKEIKKFFSKIKYTND